MSDSNNQQQALDAPNAFAEAFALAAKGDAKPDGDLPSEQEPAQAGSDEAPARAAAEGSVSGEAAAFDPWTGLTPEQKSHFERVQNSERSQRGRVGALTKKLNSLASVAPAAKPETEGESAGEQSPDDADLARVTEEYGDVVGPLVKRLETLQGQIDAIGKPAATKAEVDADAEEIGLALGELERDHPDYLTIGQDDNFHNWLGSQTPKVIALANSYDPVEVGLALSKFKIERSAAMAMQSDQGGEQGNQDSSATDKRRRQLEGSQAVTTRGAPAAAGVPNDFSSAWKARVNAPT